MRKTLEGGRPWRERAPLERVALSLQTSLSPENFPQEHPPLYGENLFRYVWAGALGESFFVFGEVFFCRVRLRTRFVLEMHKGYPLRRFSPCKKISKKTERHMGRSLQTLFSILPQSRIPFRTLQKFPPPAQTKTSPQDPHHQKDKANLRSCNGGGLWGSSGKVREVWRAGDHLRKRVSCASKVFLTFR